MLDRKIYQLINECTFCIHILLFPLYSHLVIPECSYRGSNRRSEFHGYTRGDTPLADMPIIKMGITGHNRAWHTNYVCYHYRNRVTEENMSELMRFGVSVEEKLLKKLSDTNKRQIPWFYSTFKIIFQQCFIN